MNIINAKFLLTSVYDVHHINLPLACYQSFNTVGLVKLITPRLVAQG